jgi:hypothetical protein
MIKTLVETRRQEVVKSESESMLGLMATMRRHVGLG